jgi:histidinol-phosphate aminotransferase
VTPIIEERERMRERLRELGFEPLPSEANFLYVPVDDPRGDYDRLLALGMAVRPVPGGIRLTIRTVKDDERLLDALGSLHGL